MTKDSANVPNISHSHHHEASSAYPEHLTMADLKHEPASGQGVVGLVSSWLNPAPPANVHHTHHHESNIGMPDKIPEAAVHPPPEEGGIGSLVGTYVHGSEPANLTHVHHHESNIGMPAEVGDSVHKPPGGGVASVVDSYVHPPAEPANMSPRN